jgi:hypothetical protein
MIKKTKKPSRKSLVAKLDKLVSEKVRSIGKCERCGKTTTLQAAHIYSRTYKHLRWDPENLICLCSGCHFWWHLNPVEATVWVGTIKNINYLVQMRQNTTPIKDWQLQVMLDEMKVEKKYTGLIEDEIFEKG